MNIIGKTTTDIARPGVVIIEGHVQGLANTRAFGKQGIPVYVVDVTRCVASYSKYCQKYIKCPDFYSDEFVAFLIDLAVCEDIHGWLLMPSNDHAVYSISKHREQLLKYYVFSIQELAVIDKIYDKQKLLDIATKIGVPKPNTQLLRSPEDPLKLEFPLITKGKEGLSFYRLCGKKAYVSYDQNQLRQNLTEISKVIDVKDTITQEIIRSDRTNKTLSFTAFCISGIIKAFWMGAKLREHPLQFGTATLTESVYSEECLFLSTRIIAEIGYSGICEIEFLRDPEDGLYKLIEINPRTWLWVGHAIECGVNYPLYLYNYLNGMPNQYPTNYTIGCKWFNPYTDIIYGLYAIIRRELSINDFFKQLNGKKINALWDNRDPAPFFHYGLMLMKILKER